MPSLDRFNLSVLTGLTFALCLGGVGPVLTPLPATAQEQRPNCANFLDQDDAQVAFDADTDDPFGLDGEGDGVACEKPGGGFGLQLPLVNCNDLLNDLGIAQAPYDYSLRRFSEDRYNLVVCSGQGNCGTNQGASSRPPQNLSSGGNNVVIARTGFSGETLEARLDAHFLSLED